MSMHVIDDVPPRFEYLMVKNSQDGEIQSVWGVYCTYLRYPWDVSQKFLFRDNRLLFWGLPGKNLRFKFGVDAGGIKRYYYRRLKEGYKPDPTILDRFPEIREQVIKRMTWKILRN